MTNLSLRLQEIAKLVKENAKIINVGTDHALLEIYLAKTKNVSSLGIDISEHSVKKAINNVQKNNLEEKIKIIQNDGLNNIKPTDEIIIISGLGTRTIIKILQNIKADNLIIQSNNYLYDLRKKITKMGYYIKEEKLVYDKRWYTIIYFQKGNKKYSFFELYLGLATKNKKYIDYLININAKKLKNIPKTKIYQRFKIKLLLYKLKNCR